LLQSTAASRQRSAISPTAFSNRRSAGKSLDWRNHWKGFLAFRLYLHEAARVEAERLLLARDVDIAIMLLDKKSRAGIRVRPLLELPLILLVYKKLRLMHACELWKRDKIEDTLISFPRTEETGAATK
jgi:hypothetical protein